MTVTRMRVLLAKHLTDLICAFAAAVEVYIELLADVQQ